MSSPTLPSPYIRLLGGASVEVSGVAATGRAAHRHPIALLALLVLNRGRAVSRDKLIGYLWPERDADAGRNLLKVAVHGLRKQFGDAAIKTVGDQLIADPAMLNSDVADFLDALSAGNDARAVSHYGGPLLDGFFIKDAAELDRWTDVQRAELAGAYTAAVERLAQGAEATQDTESAIGWYRTHLSADPYRADVAERLVRAMVATGDRAAAIRFAETFVRQREDDLSIGDDEDLVQLARTAPAAAENRARESPVVVAKVADIPRIPVGAPAQARRATRWPAITGVALLLAASIAGIVAYARSAAEACEGPGPCTPAAAQAAIDANVIAILPFRVNGADAGLHYLQDGMAELLAAEFMGVSGADAVDPGTVARAAGRRASPGGDIDRASALAIARQLGAGQVLMGSVVGTPARMTVTASILDAVTGDVRARTMLVEGSADSLAAVVNAIAARLLSRDVAAWRLSTNDPGTTSTDALRAFIDGRAAYKRGRHDDAFNQLTRALEIDSSFVLASYWLTVTSKLTRPVSEVKAARAYRLAWAQRDRLGPDRREMLQAMLGPTGPDVNASIATIHEAIEQATANQPASPEAWYLLGDLYFHRGSLLGYDDWQSRAKTAFERAVSLDTLVGSVSHLATIAFMERDMAAHARWLSILEHVSPKDNYTLRERYAAATLSGDAARVRGAREQWVRGGEAYRDTHDGFPWAVSAQLQGEELDSLIAALAANAATEEQRRNVVYFTRSVAMNAGRPARADVARRQYYGADALARDFDLVSYAEGDSAAAERLAVARGTSEHLVDARLCEAALSRLRRADTTGARAIATRLRAARDPGFIEGPVCAVLIEGIVASLGSRANTASLMRVDSLVRTNPPGMPSIWTYDLALAFARRGDMRTASAIAGRRMIPRSARLAVSLRDEGRWAAQAGDTARAVRAWRRYLSLRAYPEPTMAGEVAGVRRALARLEKR